MAAGTKLMKLFFFVCGLYGEPGKGKREGGWVGGSWRWPFGGRKRRTVRRNVRFGRDLKCTYVMEWDQEQAWA